MKDKLEQTLTREALAEYLELLAAQLRSGTVTLDGTPWKLPDTFETKTHVKEKRGQIRHRIEWRCSSLESYGQEAIEDVTRWRSSLKEAKKGMARAFKELKKAAAAGVIPGEAALTELERHTTVFLDLAEPEWRAATEEFMDHLRNLRKACELGHLEIVGHELQDLDTRMAACHRELR